GQGPGGRAEGAPAGAGERGPGPEHEPEVDHVRVRRRAVQGPEAARHLRTRRQPVEAVLRPGRQAEADRVQVAAGQRVLPGDVGPPGEVIAGVAATRSGARHLISSVARSAARRGYAGV